MSDWRCFRLCNRILNSW